MARVLVVEDNEAFAWTIRTMFLEHHTVTVVGSVAACSDLEHPFDVGLVDYDLPDGKGVEVVRTLLRRQPELPLVAISAHATGNAALRAAGARETCPKAEMHRIAVVLDDLLVASRPMDTTEPKTRVMAAMQGAAMLQLAFAGVAGRLLGALAEEGRGTAETIAKAAGKDLGYVTRWCDAAYAFELLDEVEDGVFALTELGRAFVPDTPGTLMPAAVGSVLGAHMIERATGLMETGERPGESVLGERPTILPWFGPMLEAQFGPFFDANIVEHVPAYRDVDQRGGTAVDLGCGNGWYLRRLASRCANLRGIGLDGFSENIDAAKAKAEAEGLSDRLTFQAGDLHDFTIDQPVELIAMNRALHHVWSDKDNVFRILAEHLVPGGWAVIWEPAWPDERKALRVGPMRPMAFQNLAEHVQGNHFLRPDEIVAELEKAGFETNVFRFAEGREAVVTGRKK